MATKAIGPDSGIVTLPNHFAPMPAVMRTLSRFDRQSLEGFITVAIGLLDVVDGDADIELNGDETDHTQSEECFNDYSFYGSGPGCIASDEDTEHDGREHEGGY